MAVICHVRRCARSPGESTCLMPDETDCSKGKTCRVVLESHALGHGSMGGLSAQTPRKSFFVPDATLVSSRVGTTQCQGSCRMEVLISRMLQNWSMWKPQRNIISLWPSIPKSQSITTAQAESQRSTGTPGPETLRPHSLRADQAQDTVPLATVRQTEEHCKGAVESTVIVIWGVVLVGSPSAPPVLPH